MPRGESSDRTGRAETYIQLKSDLKYLKGHIVMWIDELRTRISTAFGKADSNLSQDQQPSKSRSLWNCVLGNSSLNLSSKKCLPAGENLGSLTADGGLKEDELKLAFKSQVQNRKEAARSWRIEREGDIRRPKPPS